MGRIAVIPARSGSKGLPDKNIKELNGKPLIAYTIEAALQSGIFDTVHVSTDSETYAAIARQYGADVPFLRSRENASDHASSWDAVREVLTHYSGLGRQFTECALLQPTSPLRTARDIAGAWELFEKKQAGSVVSVCEVDHPIQWCFPLDAGGSMESFDRNPAKDLRRQDLQVNYRENGAIYILRTEKLHEPDFDFYAPDCYAYIMDKQTSIDIDDATDFRIAEVLMKMASVSDQA